MYSNKIFNILATALTTFLTKLINRLAFGTVSDRFVLGVSPRWTVPILSQFPIVGAFFTNRYPFEWIIAAIAVIAWYIL